MLIDKFDFLESLMREEFPENQERVIVSLNHNFPKIIALAIIFTFNKFS